VTVGTKIPASDVVPSRRREAVYQGSDLTDGLTTLGIRIAIAVVVFQSAAHLTYVFLTDGRANQFNLDAEQNAFSWASSGTTFCAAFLVFLLGLLATQKRMRFFVLSGIIALFSLDDALALHEELGSSVKHALGLPDGLGHLWPVFFFPVLAISFLLLWDLARSTTGRVRAVLQGGIALLVLGVVSEASVSAWYVRGGEAETWPGALQIVLEEGAELAGWILIVTGLVATACASLLRIGAAGGLSRGADRQ
jgi:hypothetical protein